ncbi:hypothetical protein [Clostridium sp. Marseille-Q7071]
MDGTVIKQCCAILSKGNYSYGETTGKKHMSYRGIEDMGNCLYFVEDFCDGSMNMIGNRCFNDSGIGYKAYGTVMRGKFGFYK